MVVDDAVVGFVGGVMHGRRQRRRALIFDIFCVSLLCSLLFQRFWRKRSDGAFRDESFVFFVAVFFIKKGGRLENIRRGFDWFDRIVYLPRGK